ncbi:hypothetical protein [Acidianus manzaensis]|uniref:Uncharacterized protein n=1 Tax=Acidianus manzaensis TaxID=282676 RepID=A0A1W6JXI9_9CREN|nr:hypothetical protein [Acidianus manzaensis]ARM75021.1 hypothetical protein B6F84_02570 [Acidianus manzaensis]
MKQLLSIKNLNFTPIASSSLLKINFESFPVRINLKSNFFFSLSKKEGLKIKKFINYSGIPELYDPKFDSWKLTFDKKSEGLVVTTKFEENYPILDFSSLKSFKSFNEVLKGMYNNLLIESFLIDYGTRDLIVDVFTYSEKVQDILEFIPFIRFTISTEIENDLLYITELSIPYKYFRSISEILSEIKTECNFLFTLNKKPYVSRII